MTASFGPTGTWCFHLAPPGDRMTPPPGPTVLSLLNRPCLTESGPLSPRSQLIRPAVILAEMISAGSQCPISSPSSSADEPETQANGPSQRPAGRSGPD